jgi:hypothetical protein
MKNAQQFTLFWRTGEREVVQGRTIAKAMTLAGYGSGALPALDFYASGNDNRYKWNATIREWDVVEKPIELGVRDDQ